MKEDEESDNQDAEETERRMRTRGIGNRVGVANRTKRKRRRNI